MVKGVFSITDATYAVAISGMQVLKVQHKKNQLVHFVLCIGKRNDVLDAGILHLQGNRALIIEWATNVALCLLYRRIAHNLLYFENDRLYSYRFRIYKN